LLDRYGKEISPKHKGHREELWKIGVIKRDKIAQYSLVALTPKIVADYRDRRLKAVAESTVRHELNAISAAYKVASREWGIAVTNPVSLIKRPSASNERKRRVSAEEVEAITPVTITQYDGLTTAQLIEWALCDLGDSDELGLALLLRLQEVQDELDMLKAGREAALDDAIEEFRKH
jgi:integrase